MADELDDFLDSDLEPEAAPSVKRDGGGLDQLSEILGMRFRSPEVKSLSRGALAGLTQEKDFQATGALEKVGKFAGEVVPGAAFGPAGEAIRQSLSMAAGNTNAADAAKEVFKVAALSGAFKAGGAIAGKAASTQFAKSLRGSLIKFGSQLIKTTSGVPEKFGAAVLSNPDILTKAPTLEAAGKIYRDAIRGTPGARDYLLEQSGDLIMSAGDATKIVNEAFVKLSSAKEIGLAEALAARQSASFLLQAAKLGNPEQRANLSNLIKAKNALDDFLESGLPGFKSASKTYFEANAREAFTHILPQNKNLSANVLRGLGGLAVLSSGMLMKAPFLIAAALPLSPRVQGLAIRGASKAAELTKSQAAQFAARASAIKAMQGD